MQQTFIFIDDYFLAAPTYLGYQLSLARVGVSDHRRLIHSTNGNSWQAKKKRRNAAQKYNSKYNLSS